MQIIGVYGGSTTLRPTQTLPRLNYHAILIRYRRREPCSVELHKPLRKREVVLIIEIGLIVTALGQRYAK